MILATKLYENRNVGVSNYIASAFISATQTQW